MAWTDWFGAIPRKKNDPGEAFVAITPNDGTDLVTASRGLLLGVGGNVQITDMMGNTVILTGLAGGIIHPIRASRVWTTNTTASSIVTCS